MATKKRCIRENFLEEKLSKIDLAITLEYIRLRFKKKKCNSLTRDRVSTIFTKDINNLA